MPAPSDLLTRVGVTVLACAVVWTQVDLAIPARLAVAGLLVALGLALLLVPDRRARGAVLAQAVVAALPVAGPSTPTRR